MRPLFDETAAACCGLALLFAAGRLGGQAQSATKREFVWSAPGQEILAPRFSPDGEAIALVTRAHGSPESKAEEANPRFGDPVVKVIDAHGNVICQAKYGWRPSLSPDHRRVVFSEQVKPITGLRGLASPMEGNAIRMYDCETKQTLKIADPRVGYLSSPFFSAEGGSIIYTNNEAINGSMGGAVGISAFDLRRNRDTILLDKKTVPTVPCRIGDSTQSKLTAFKCSSLRESGEPIPVSFPQIVYDISSLGNEVVALLGLPIPAAGDLFMSDRYDLSLVSVFPAARTILSLGKSEARRDETAFQPLAGDRVLLFSKYWKVFSTSSGAQLPDAVPRNTNSKCRYSPDLQYYLCPEGPKGYDADHFTLYRTADAKVLARLPKMEEVNEVVWSPTSSRFAVIGARAGEDMSKGHTEQIVVYSVRSISSLRQSQQPFSFCVVSHDTASRPAFLGFETENHAAIRAGGAVRRAYPIIRNVVPRSHADSAGIRDGDELRAIDGHDLVKQRDSARVRGPGVPVVLTIGRGDTTFDRVLIPESARACK
jgi:hypothetical protein